MLRYMRFDSNLNLFKKKYKMVLLFSIILILVILMYNIIINNHSNNEIKIISKNSRRIISNLDNYTETMSDFIVNNNYNSTNEILLELKGFKEKELEIQKEQLEVQKEQLEVQKEQLEVQKELKGFKEKELEIQIRKNAIEFLENNYGIKPKHYNLDFYINNNKCIKQLLNLNTDLFSLLLNIDYENLTVSFNYFNENKYYNDYIERNIVSNYFNNYYLHSNYYNNDIISYSINLYTPIFKSYKLLTNYYENIINNPIYKILKNKLEFDINFTYNFEYYNDELNYLKQYHYNNIWFNINNISYMYNNYPASYVEYISNNIVINNNIIYYDNYPNPYKTICNIWPIKNTNRCMDLSVYDYYTNITDYDRIYCDFSRFIEYENDKFNRYSNLNKPYSNVYTLYYYEYYILFNEYEYIRELINLEEIPIIPPIKF